MRVLFVIVSFLFSINSIGQQKLPDKHFRGVVKDTFTNGKILTETSYKNEEKNGIEKYYYESGSIHAEYPYKHNRLNGVYKEYFENGKLKKLITYAHGKRNGIAEEFGGFGAKLITIKTYKNDSLYGLSEEYYTHWFWHAECTNPYLKKDSSFENGKPKGGSQNYYVDSVVKKESYYKNGILNGLSKEYYNNGILKKENMYANGKLNGVSKGYYENGTIGNQVYYKKGKLYKVPVEYEKNGAIKSSRQTKSMFYNDKRQLIADTNYKISKKQMKKFIPIEKYLKKFIQDHVDYPEQAKDNHDTGYVIVSFKIGVTDTLQQIKIEKAFEKKNYLSNEVKRVFKKIPRPASAYSKHLRNRKYFLAIRFQLREKISKQPGFIEIIGLIISLHSINN